ncbi:hypothetical protein [Desulfonema magnum]|uniref:Uncharacterized protein n=1 Tax=Desulfonema magnum TaxID=45655 RepID=A0A975BNT2_9BACT|nr:hypothetical protein [Desulfonema magnum]QTA88942.1 Uncharacterized protein dnm_049890 [Desulfonema magnum]
METKTVFKPLQGQDEYTRYFNHLCSVFENMLELFKVRADKKDTRHHESVVMSDFLSKMLYTTEALRRKYTYNPSHTLKIDLSDSGLPSFFNVNNLTTDLLNREKRLEELPTMQALKQELLDFMFKYKTEPNELLRRASEGSYYKMLDQDKLLLTFTPGSLRKMKKEKKRFRTYTFSWACYDFATNRPYIHIMMFDQDTASIPLEEHRFNYTQFLETVRAEGSRAPGIGILALGMDGSLKDIHPKIIKRICVGPICSKHFSEEPEKLCSLLTRNGENEDDFILLFDEDVILSRDQTVSKSVFSFGQVRETFYIPEADTECYDRKASKIHKHMLVPHRVLQHMDFKGDFREYSDHEIITYDKEGGIYVN